MYLSTYSAQQSLTICKNVTSDCRAESYELVSLRLLRTSPVFADTEATQTHTNPAWIDTIVDTELTETDDRSISLFNLLREAHFNPATLIPC